MTDLAKDGDWDDGVVVTSDPDPLAIAWSIEFGESIPNTQMAVRAKKKVFCREKIINSKVRLKCGPPVGNEHFDWGTGDLTGDLTGADWSEIFSSDYCQSFNLSC